MLVSVDELLSYMSNLNLATPQKAQAEVILDGVQSELETYCNRPLELTQIREMVITDNAGYANLSYSPIHSIVKLEPVEVMFLPEPLNMLTPYIPAPLERNVLIGDHGKVIDNTPSGITLGDPLIAPGGAYIGIRGVHYVIEYIGGMDLRSRHEYRGVCLDILRIAAREVGGMYNDNLSLREGNAEAASKPDERGKGWTPEELEKWDRLRRRIVL